MKAWDLVGTDTDSLSPTFVKFKSTWYENRWVPSPATRHYGYNDAILLRTGRESQVTMRSAARRRLLGHGERNTCSTGRGRAGGVAVGGHILLGKRPVLYRYVMGTIGKRTCGRSSACGVEGVCETDGLRTSSSSGLPISCLHPHTANVEKMQASSRSNPEESGP